MARIIFYGGANIETFICVYVPIIAKEGFNISQEVIEY